MADPIKVLQSLGSPLASQYAVFERDQVLTHTQLNEVSTWLDQQDRLTRISLLGVGVVTGLQVSTDGSAVSVAPGLGITTDGDLIRLSDTQVLSRVRSYDGTAPQYRPFFNVETGAMLDISELVAEDDPLGSPLSTLPGAIEQRAVLLLMESTQSDPDLCTGADCDNLGRENQHRLRVLLVERDAAARLAGWFDTRAERAAALDELQAFRPRIGTDLNSAEALLQHYRDANSSTAKGLISAFAQLDENFQDLLGSIFGRSPTGDWGSALRRLLEQSQPGAVQSGFGFLKDLVATWNELRNALLTDDAARLPSPDAFPKHLLVGALDGSTDATGGDTGAQQGLRTPYFPSAIDSAARQADEQIRFLLRRLDAQISQYRTPTDKVLRVTPSHAEDRALGERAIPWYYQAALSASWNLRLSARRLGGHNLGYRAGETAYQGSARARNPLAGSIGGHAFFRVEGHLGRPVNEVSAELKKIIAERNLPFDVHAVLAHNEKKKIKFRPDIRYTDLHRFHYLLRQDVSLRLEESDSFSTQFTERLSSAVKNDEIPANTGGVEVVMAARKASSAMSSLAGNAKAVLQQQQYSNYRSGTVETRWNNAFSETIKSVGSVRANLGELARNDFVSPVDSLIQTTHPLWLDWLDDLIKAKDDKADDKLLLSRFAADHPGLDHLGGAWRGGSLVLVYDDSEQVIADFTLAYPCAELDEPEPVEPPLKRPPLLRPPIFDLNPLKVIKPLDLKIDSLVGRVVSTQFDRAKLDLSTEITALQTDFKIKLDKQSANIDGLVKGAFSTKEATAAGVVLGSKNYATGDAVLDELVKDVEYKRQKVQTLVDLVSRGDLPEDKRGQAQSLLAKAQAELGSSVADTTEHVVVQKVDTSSGGAAGVASVLANSTMYVTDATVSASLGVKLESLKVGNVGASQTFLLGNLQSLNRLKRTP